MVCKGFYILQEGGFEINFRDGEGNIFLYLWVGLLNEVVIVDVVEIGK